MRTLGAQLVRGWWKVPVPVGRHMMPADHFSQFGMDEAGPIREDRERPSRRAHVDGRPRPFPNSSSDQGRPIHWHRGWRPSFDVR